MQLLSLTIAAGEKERLDRAGAVFLLYDLGGAPDVDVTLLNRGSAATLIPAVKRGLKITIPAGFTGVEITNNGAAPAVIRFFIIHGGDGEVQFTDNLIIGNDAGNPVPVDILGATITADRVGILSPDTLMPLDDVAIGAGARAVLAPAAAVGIKQREVIVKNLFGNAAIVRVGDITCNAAKGHELAPGEAMTIDTLAAVYAWNTGGAAQSVSVLTNTRV